MNKRQKKEVTNQGDEAMVIVAITNDGKNLSDPPNDEGDKCLIYYDWLANSAMISHITNCWDTFTTYETHRVVCGVGNKSAYAIGKGTIELISYVNEWKFIICLEDVLYIPTTKMI